MVLGLAGLALAAGANAWAEPVESPSAGDAASESSVAPGAKARSIAFAALVEARIESFKHTYSDQEGPWTHVRLTDVNVHLGSVPLASDGTLTIRQFGGALPDGSAIRNISIPAMGGWKRVLLFLKAPGWTESPILLDHAFRIERIGGRDVLVDADGLGVIGLSGRGALTGPAIYEPGTTWRKAPPFVTDPSGPEVARLVDKSSFIEAVAVAASAGAVELVATEFDAAPRRDPNTKWNEPRPAPPKPTDTNPYPCDEQVREAEGTACLGGIPTEPKSISQAEMEACLKGGAR